MIEYTRLSKLERGEIHLKEKLENTD